MTHDTPTQCLHIRDNQWRNIVVSRDLGQFVKIQDCPGDSGAVGAYEVRFSIIKVYSFYRHTLGGINANVAPFTNIRGYVKL